ncbi:hypothetical protein BGZ65_011702, partial [Modicella reniformis]
MSDHSLTNGFQSGYGTPVWSPELTPVDEPEYISTLIGLFLLSIGFRALMAAQGYLEAYLHLHFYPRPTSTSTSTSTSSSSIRSQQRQGVINAAGQVSVVSQEQSLDPKKMRAKDHLVHIQQQNTPRLLQGGSFQDQGVQRHVQLEQQLKLEEEEENEKEMPPGTRRLDPEPELRHRLEPKTTTTTTTTTTIPLYH